MKQPFRLDLENIKRKAREHMLQGAVTENYGADREAVIKVLNEVLATELVCNLRYRNNALVAQGIHAEAVAAEFTEHAGQEQQHADMIANRIVQLGGEPNMDPATLTARSHADYTTSRDIKTLLRENLIAERVAIDTYAEIVRWLGDDDPTTRRLLEQVLEQEEEHADDLASLLEGTNVA
ncbi:MAG TPA: ferritin-like domain-containing protein [Polyangiales bacterium]|nr:ferritin-like domain-containing protein [Polyangiales bacterium]